MFCPSPSAREARGGARHPAADRRRVLDAILFTARALEKSRRG
jgi:hypothetical protein